MAAHELLHDEAAREVRGHRAVVAMGLYAAATKAAQSTHKKKEKKNDNGCGAKPASARHASAHAPP